MLLPKVVLANTDTMMATGATRFRISFNQKKKKKENKNITRKMKLKQFVRVSAKEIFKYLKVELSDLFFGGGYNMI